MRERIIDCLTPLEADAGEAPLAAAGGREATTGPRPREAGSLTPAAVLVPVIEHPGGPSILLTRRAEHLSSHRGQISFPGGRAEPGDRDAAATALRETHEEVGIPPSRVEVRGRLDFYRTGTRYVITPVVGFVPPGLALRLDNVEVADAFEVPLAFITDKANIGVEVVEWRGRRRRYYVIEFRGRRIWGATAAILIDLVRRLRR